MNNQNILHIEDLILSGKTGLFDTFMFFNELKNTFSGKTTKKIKTSLKWDGSPSIVCGVNPENGKFFVGTKSVFNKTPKINYNNKDIKINHKNNPAVAKLLGLLLQYLPALKMDGVYQGDLLFWPGLIKRRRIGNKNHLTFKPNTITYSIENKTKLGNKVSVAQLGIVFHTKYVGKKMNKLTPQYNPDISGFDNIKDIWAIDSSYEGISFLSNVENKNISTYLNHIKSADIGSFLDVLNNNAVITDYLVRYINSNIKKNINVFSLSSFKCWLLDRIDMEKSKLKSKLGKDRREEKKKKIFEFLSGNEDNVKSMFEVRGHIMKIKNIFVKKINTMYDVGVFFETGGNLEKTQPEGLVVVSTKNNVVKLVDRFEFSRKNFIVSSNQ
jgi:hypothetical protein